MPSKFVLLVIGILAYTSTARNLVGSKGAFNDEKTFSLDHPISGVEGFGDGGGLGGGISSFKLYQIYKLQTYLVYFVLRDAKYHIPWLLQHTWHKKA
jgi:hypothetical protein